MPRPIPGMGNITRAPTGLSPTDIQEQARTQTRANTSKNTSKEERRLKSLLDKAGQQNGLLLDNDMQEVRELAASLGITVTIKRLELNEEYRWQDNPDDNPFVNPPTYVPKEITI